VHNTFLETVWTIIPSAILILILIPTFILFYAAGLDSEYINAQRPYIIQGSNKVKIIKFDSYTLKVSSSGVLDSWVLPYSGIKLDACPGFFKKTGIEIYSIYEEEHVGDEFIMAHRRGALSTVVKGQDFLM
jgi:heme/copper-type cytochrome/quinol oxidase subunit 2